MLWAAMLETAPFASQTLEEVEVPQAARAWMENTAAFWRMAVSAAAAFAPRGGKCATACRGTAGRRGGGAAWASRHARRCSEALQWGVAVGRGSEAWRGAALASACDTSPPASTAAPISPGDCAISWGWLGDDPCLDLLSRASPCLPVAGAAVDRDVGARRAGSATRDRAAAPGAVPGRNAAPGGLAVLRGVSLP